MNSSVETNKQRTKGCASAAPRAPADNISICPVSQPSRQRSLPCMAIINLKPATSVDFLVQFCILKVVFTYVKNISDISSLHEIKDY